MVAPQNNNLAAAFPLAPRSLHQNLRWSKETTRESYLVRGACGRAQPHRATLLLPRMGRVAFYASFIFCSRGRQRCRVL